jgi:hypothetical protein
MMDDQDTAEWPCPYCRSVNALAAPACRSCGAHLRDTGDDLFTTVAADNAEVVPPHAPAGPESLWSTDAHVAPSEEDPGAATWDDGADDADWVDAELLDDTEPADRAPLDDEGDAGWQDPGYRTVRRSSTETGAGEDADGPDPVAEDRFRAPAGEQADDRRESARPSAPPVDDLFATFRPSFSAEPVTRRDDVVDMPFATASGSGDTDEPVVGRRGAALFGSRATDRAGTEPSAGPFSTPAPPTRPRPSEAPAPGGANPFGERWAASDPGTAAPSGPPPITDEHGLAAAVARLHPLDAERASVPFTVVGALLLDGEVVFAAVAGQMLGHPAAVVLTDRRVLVVNGRRWQPIIDEFELGDDLVVRGRHDRDVAALTFVDARRMSTVDGIGEVGLAVELAERASSS